MFGKIPQYAIKAIEILQGHGFQAHLVGGCVRDILMGREPQDYDINTNAMPQEMRQVFAGYRQVDTGIRHGTLSVWIDGHQLEITTYRSDGKYSDGRHPDQVRLGVDLTEDLRRRDFTINAMCWSPNRGMTDLFGGAEDLTNRVIRCVGNPEERFTEDALRILRALRFAAVLDGHIDPATDMALRKMAPTLDKVSRERCSVELVKLLLGPGAGRIIMDYPEVLDQVIPGMAVMKGYEQQNPYHCYTLLEHTARVVDAVPAEPVDRLAALLHDLAKPECCTSDAQGVAHYKGHQARGAEIARGVLQNLRMDGDTIDAVVQLIRHHDDNVDGISEAGVRRMLGNLGTQAFDRLMWLKKADNMAQNREKSDRIPNLDRICTLKEEILAANKPFNRGQLAVTGRDLADLGIKEGPVVGVILEQLLELVIEEQLPNTKEALLQHISNII